VKYTCPARRAVVSKVAFEQASAKRNATASACASSSTQAPVPGPLVAARKDSAERVASSHQIAADVLDAPHQITEALILNDRAVAGRTGSA
jgi:hypothetical protein